MADNTATLDSLAGALGRAGQQPGGALKLLETVSGRLRRMVGFDGLAMNATDPASLLPTCPVRVENVAPAHTCDAYWQRESLVEDANLFRDLARASQPVATLSAATGGDPARSARFREFLEPQGYREELRAALRVGATTWGFVSIFRERARSPFTDRDVQTVAAAGPVIAAALRDLAGSPTQEPSARPTRAADGPGTALFDSKHTLLSLDQQAQRWFTELAGPQWQSWTPPAMTGIMAIIGRARAVATGQDSRPASARLRTSSGLWLTAHASCLSGPDGEPGPIAMIIEPAKSAQIAPIIVEAYRLTPREQQITLALSRGQSNREIALDLHLSANTVRDHLKAIFAKMGVNSRGELTAKLFADHYRPALHDPAAPIAHVDI